MKIVNRSGVPDAIFEYLKTTFYDYEAAKGSISATSLLKPIQEIILTERYNDKIELDCVDQMWSLFGSGVHAVLERVKGDVPIHRMFADVDGVRVSGKYDLIRFNTIIDFKVTSAWTLVFNSRQSEWKRQLSIYRWLYWKESGNLLNDNGVIIAILRDWSEKNIKDNSNYPKSPMLEIPIKLHSVELTEKFIVRKIEHIKKARELKDNELPPCTNEERWHNGKTGRYAKCDRYCNAKPFCYQAR